MVGACCEFVRVTRRSALVFRPHLIVPLGNSHIPFLPSCPEINCMKAGTTWGTVGR
jgi:hypothetical protein